MTEIRNTNAISMKPLVSLGNGKKSFKFNVIKAVSKLVKLVLTYSTIDIRIKHLRNLCDRGTTNPSHLKL